MSIAGAPSADAAAPVRVLLHLPDVVAAGFAVLVGPYAERLVVVAPDDPAAADVEVFDPDDEGADSAVGLPRVALARAPGEERAERARALGAVRVLCLGHAVEEVLHACEQARHETPTDAARVRGEDLLSPRETDVLDGIRQGYDNREIAADLRLSVNTVKTYIRTAYRKIDVGSRPEALLWVLDRERRRGLTPTGDETGAARVLRTYERGPTPTSRGPGDTLR